MCGCRYTLSICILLQFNARFWIKEKARGYQPGCLCTRNASSSTQHLLPCERFQICSHTGVSQLQQQRTWWSHSACFIDCDKCCHAPEAFTRSLYWLTKPYATINVLLCCGEWRCILLSPLTSKPTDWLHLLKFRIVWLVLKVPSYSCEPAVDPSTKGCKPCWKKGRMFKRTEIVMKCMPWFQQS